MAITEIKAEIKAVRKEMRSKGIRRISCFNAGLSGEVYRLNSRMFELETKLQNAEKEERIQRMDASVLLNVLRG